MKSQHTDECVERHMVKWMDEWTESWLDEVNRHVHEWNAMYTYASTASQHTY